MVNILIKIVSYIQSTMLLLNESFEKVTDWLQADPGMESMPKIECSITGYVKILSQGRNKMLLTKVKFFQIWIMSPELRIFKVGCWCQALFFITLPCQMFVVSMKLDKWELSYFRKKTPIFKIFFLQIQIYSFRKYKLNP